MRKNSIFLLVLCLCAATHLPALGANVNGSCFLEDRSVHCLTSVEASGILPHETVTDASGYYQLYGLAALQSHEFTFEHPGFFPETHNWYVPLLGGEMPDVTLESKAVCDPAIWEYYPFTPSGTEITFPYDEGKHDPTSTYRVEWWYLNFHLEDEDGNKYGGFVAFFKPPVLGLPCMVLSSVIDLQQGISYQHYEFPLVFLAQDQYLDVTAGGNRLVQRSCEGYLLPFEYHLYAGWVVPDAVTVTLDMKALKPPMPVGGDGFVEFGSEAWSYYYSHPRLDVLGSLHLPGFPLGGKKVQGTAWIDHQWANFPPYSVTWEWLSIQLENDIEIMVADAWVDGEPEGSFSGGLNYYGEGCDLEILPDYTLTPLALYLDPVTQREFVIEWQVEEPTRQIDLNVAANFDNQVMRVGENQILPTCFWEGACTVTGSIGGQPVSGTAYAEVTHPAGCLQPPTVAAEMICAPLSGTLPFSLCFDLTLANLYTEYYRSQAARIDVQLANGTPIQNWKHGILNLAGAESRSLGFNQYIPNLSLVRGTNIFTLVAEDITGPPYNQPPYPCSGDTATAVCNVDGNEP